MARATAAQAQEGAQAGDTLPTWARWVLPLLLFVVALVPFWPATSYGFVDYDDDRNFYPQFNPWFNAQRHELSGETLEWMLTASHFGHYQPLTWISFGVDAALAGRFDPGVFHRTNLLLHGLNAALVYLLARRLLAAAARGRAAELPLALAAAATSLLYALHPLRVESVAWITERRDVLSGAFLLGSVLCYLRFAARGAGRVPWMVLSLLAFALSLGAKAWGITLPAVLLVLDLYPLRRREGAEPEPWGRLLGEKLLYAVPAAIFAWLAKGAQADIGATVAFSEHGWVQRFAQACYGLLFYPFKTLWPSALSPLYLLEPALDPTGPVYLAGMALVTAAGIALFAARRRLPGLVAAAVAYAILVSPVLGFLQSGSQKVADRYTYLAALPLTLLVGWLVLRLAQPPAAAVRRAAALAGVLVVAATLGALSRAQTRVWRDSESVYRQVVEVEPDNYFGLHCLAVVLQQRRDRPRQQVLSEALEFARASVAAHPGFGNVEARRNVALLLQGLGRPAEAEAELRAALEVAPAFLPVLQDLVNRRLRARDPEGALAVVERSLALAPGFLDGYAQLAKVQLARDRPDLALEAWRRGLAADPGWPQGNYELGLEALAAGRADEAEGRFQRALRRGVPGPDVLIDLGRALQAQGRTQEARMRYEQALTLEPANGRARALLQGLGAPAAR